MFGPDSGGGIFNLGAPEVMVIGFVAYTVLGPKELFKIAREVGDLLGQWQELGQQARRTFQEALEAEMAEEDNQAAEKAAAEQAAANVAAGVTAPPPPVPAPAPPPMSTSEAEPVPTAGSGPPKGPSKGTEVTIRTPSGEESTRSISRVDSLPPLSEYTALRSEDTSAPGDEELASLRESMLEDFGDPETNRATFQEQISGVRNKQVLAEYPAELGAPPPMDGSAEDVQYADEALLATQISQAENELATLRAEQQVLALKRKQLQANAQRAQRMAEEQKDQVAEDA